MSEMYLCTDMVTRWWLSPTQQPLCAMVVQELTGGLRVFCRIRAPLPDEADGAWASCQAEGARGGTQLRQASAN